MRLCASVLSLSTNKADAGHKHSAADVTSGTLPVDRGGTGEATYQKAMAALSKPQTGDWRTAEPGVSAWYYESADATAYNLPFTHCIVLVIKKGANRGTAIAFGWNVGAYQMWRNVLHDDAGTNKWSNWVEARDAIGAGLNNIYPVGSIYMSASYNSPASIFGGTWERLKDRFLLGAGDTYQDGQTGGAASVGLTLEQIPSHAHTIPGAGNVYYASGGDSMWINKPSANTGYSTTTSAAGSGQVHNNMPPYLVVFMWKRTA